MNDLLSPILVAMDGDEAEAFWCFAAVMDRRAALFASDQAGMTLALEMLGGSNPLLRVFSSSL